MLLGILLAAIAALTAPSALAQVDVETHILEDSILASFTAVDGPIDDIAVWFQPNSAIIEEYTMEPGWLVADTPESIRLYGGILEDGHTLHLGIKIRGEAPTIYWSASLDNTELQWGILLDSEPATPDADEAPAIPDQAILDTSKFRTVPEKPLPGSPVRLVGSGFGPLQEVDISVGGRVLEPLQTDSTGRFVVTRTIPDTLEGRVDFVLTDDTGADLQISLRLGESVVKERGDSGLSLNSLESEYDRGARITVSGTAAPLDSVIFWLYGPSGDTITIRVVTAAHDGSWSIAESLIIPLDTPLGEYSLRVSDGDQILDAAWTVKSSKVILLEPVRTIFEPGDTIRFNGTATPDEIVYLILQDPTGDELVLDSWMVDSSGLVEWEFPTTPNSRKGTYTLIVSQGAEREFVYAGLGTVAEAPTTISFDKVNYLSSENPNIVIAGKPGDIISILVLDDTDTVVHRGNATLQPDGRVVYNLDISTFSSGVYTAIAQRGAVQTDHEFGVGLSLGASALDISVRDEHMPGDPVLVLGTTSSNVVLFLTLEDPNGDIVQRVETLAGKTGMFTEQRLRIPLDAESGIWKVRAVSGPNSDLVEMSVLMQSTDGLAVYIDDSDTEPIIVVTGATRAYVTITITEGERTVVPPQRAYVTASGIGQLPWNIDLAGLYTITAKAGSETVTITYRYDP